MIFYDLFDVLDDFFGVFAYCDCSLRHNSHLQSDSLLLSQHRPSARSARPSPAGSSSMPCTRGLRKNNQTFCCEGEDWR